MEMSDSKEIGENCTFIFKKRALKSRSNRKRQQSSSDESNKSTLPRPQNIPIVSADADDSDEATSSVVRPTKRKGKSNPNVHCTKRLSKREKTGGSGDSSGSDDEVVGVSYKSKKSAMPEGPADQGATAVLVSQFVLLL